MHVGVPSVIALLWVILVSGCAGNEIAPAESAAPAPGDSDPVTALYAAPTDVAFITVSDIRADIVGPDGVPFDVLYGYGHAAEGALVPPLEDLALALTEADAVAPPFNGRHRPRCLLCQRHRRARAGGVGAGTGNAARRPGHPITAARRQVGGWRSCSWGRQPSRLPLSWCGRPCAFWCGCSLDRKATGHDPAPPHHRHPLRRPWCVTAWSGSPVASGARPHAPGRRAARRPRKLAAWCARSAPRRVSCCWPPCPYRRAGP